MHLLHWPQRQHWEPGWGDGTLPSNNASWPQSLNQHKLQASREMRGEPGLLLLCIQQDFLERNVRKLKSCAFFPLYPVAFLE